MTLSKVYDRTDSFDTSILGIVERHWDTTQHESRRWEYAMALEAHRRWRFGRDDVGQPAQSPVDIGGAGSPFHKMIEGTSIIDPALPGNYTLGDYVGAGTELSDAVFCISVIEHVDDLDQFLYHLSCLVAPGGLLFLTTDFCDGFHDPKEGGVPDVYHFHWMRKRIFNIFSMNQTAGAFYKRDFDMLGGLEADWKWHGPIENWGYAPASLALVKHP